MWAYATVAWQRERDRRAQVRRCLPLCLRPAAAPPRNLPCLFCSSRPNTPSIPRQHSGFTTISVTSVIDNCTSIALLSPIRSNRTRGGREVTLPTPTNSRPCKGIPHHRHTSPSGLFLTGRTVSLCELFFRAVSTCATLFLPRMLVAKLGWSLARISTSSNLLTRPEAKLDKAPS